ncbi:hypothetical protein CPB85DRAFT_1434352 [Mucidula mucida]|nr:hypothetical protein CPB85DRAFT_1434352 [Mucidula mucida]
MGARQADPKAAAELIAPFAVQLASSLAKITDENEAIVAIQLVWGTFLSNDTARAALHPHFNAMLSVLAGSNTNELTRNTVYSLLEELFGSEQASTYTPVVTTQPTTMISTHEDDRALLSGFYVCSVFGWSLCTKVLLTAGASELAQESLLSTNKDVYAQAQGVLLYYLTDTDFQELVGKDVTPLRESIIRKFIDLIFNAERHLLILLSRNSRDSRKRIKR